MAAVANVLGTLLAYFGLAYLFPVATSFITGDGQALAFALTAIGTSGLGLLISFATRRRARELKPRDGFLLATLS